MIKFAIVGAGWIGGIHADRLQVCPGAQLNYVFDVSSQAASSFARKYGCTAVSSIDEACTSADAVIIASSTTSHEQVALKCIAAKTPFLIEKPVAHNLVAAKTVSTAADAARVPSTVGFNRRFHPGYREIRDAVAEGRLGNVESLKFTVKTATPPSPEFLKSSGGLFGEFGIHFFDLARWIMNDEPVEVFASGSTLTDVRYAKIGQIDTAAAIVRMSRGALFQLDIGWRSAYGHDERLEVFGSEGVFTSGDPVITVPLDLAGERDGAKLPDWFERFEATYLVELSMFVGMLNGEPMQSPTLHDGVVAQMLAEAANRSVAMNTPVRVDTEAYAVVPELLAG